MELHEYAAELAARVEKEFAARGYVYGSVKAGTGADAGHIVVEYPDPDGNLEAAPFSCGGQFQSQKMWLESADQATVDELYEKTAAAFADFWMSWYARMLQDGYKKDVMMQRMSDLDYVYENVYAELVDLGCEDPDLHTVMYDNALNLAYAFKIADPACTIWYRVPKSAPFLAVIDHQRMLAEALAHTDRHVRSRMQCRNMLDALADEMCGPNADPAERQSCIDYVRAQAGGKDVGQYVVKLKDSALYPSAVLLSRYAMSRIAADIGARSGLFVIPSSIHELLVHDLDSPELLCDRQVLRDAVPETNAQLPPDEVLAGMPYAYDLKAAVLKAF